MMRILGPRVLVLLPPKETVQDEATGYTYQDKTSPCGLIILAKPADAYDVEVATRGMVMQVGEKSRAVDLDEVRMAIDAIFAKNISRRTRMHDALDALEPAPFDVAVGDCVLFPPSAGERFNQDGHSYAILNESEIVGVLTPKGATNGG